MQQTIWFPFVEAMHLGSYHLLEKVEVCSSYHRMIDLWSRLYGSLKCRFHIVLMILEVYSEAMLSTKFSYPKIYFRILWRIFWKYILLHYDVWVGKMYRSCGFGKQKWNQASRQWFHLLNSSNLKEFNIFNDPEFLAYLAWCSTCVPNIIWPFCCSVYCHMELYYKPLCVSLVDTWIKTVLNCQKFLAGSSTNASRVLLPCPYLWEHTHN